MRTSKQKSNSPVISDFAKRCYSLLRKVPRGRVTTYGELAKAMKTKGFRAVGMVLNKNPFAPEVPCHRVVMGSGFIGGFAFGVEKKIKLLKAEGVVTKNGKVIDFDKLFFRLCSKKSS